MNIKDIKVGNYYFFKEDNNVYLFKANSVNLNFEQAYTDTLHIIKDDMIYDTINANYSIVLSKIFHKANSEQLINFLPEGHPDIPIEDLWKVNNWVVAIKDGYFGSTINLAGYPLQKGYIRQISNIYYDDLSIIGLKGCQFVVNKSLLKPFKTEQEAKDYSNYILNKTIQKKSLPKSFGIKTDDILDEKWKIYISWLNSIKNDSYDGNLNNQYYGITNENRHVQYTKNKKWFDTILTLDEFFEYMPHLLPNNKTGILTTTIDSNSKINKNKNDSSKNTTSSKVCEVNRFVPEVSRGQKPRGATIRGRTSRNAIESRHLSNQASIISC